MKLAENVTFGGTGRDRGHALRADAAKMAALLPQARILALWRGQPLFAPEGLGWLDAGHAVLEGGSPPIFLGFWPEEGTPPAQLQGVFAVDISHWRPEEGVPGPDQAFDHGWQPHPKAPQGYAFGELRQRMADLSPDEAEIAATARALLEWHRSHGFCPNCGQATASGGGGWHRACPACQRQHFPRTDPVVIMLVTRGNALLLGRSPGWPEGMYSLLAGFIEPGETMEAAVRREVFEETGVTCGGVRYLASQPWPFPASLMLGCQTEALDETITLDPLELEDALWITREEGVEVIAGTHAKVRAPRKGSIAQFLLVNWLADRLD